jgi:hypothetical protein
LTAFEVAEFVGCHEETARRAYLRSLLVSQRFGARGRRFHPDVGHAEIKQTQRYLNITDEELRKSMTGVWERRRQLRAVGQ